MSTIKDLTTWETKDVIDWFKGIGMEKYVENIESNEIDGYDLVLMKEDDFDKINIKNIHDKNYIIKGIKLLLLEQFKIIIDYEGKTANIQLDYNKELTVESLMNIIKDMYKSPSKLYMITEDNDIIMPSVKFIDLLLIDPERYKNIKIVSENSLIPNLIPPYSVLKTKYCNLMAQEKENPEDNNNTTDSKKNYLEEKSFRTLYGTTTEQFNNNTKRNETDSNKKEIENNLLKEDENKEEFKINEELKEKIIYNEEEEEEKKEDQVEEKVDDKIKEKIDEKNKEKVVEKITEKKTDEKVDEKKTDEKVDEKKYDIIQNEEPKNEIIQINEKTKINKDIEELKPKLEESKELDDKIESKKTKKDNKTNYNDIEIKIASCKKERKTIDLSLDEVYNKYKLYREQMEKEKEKEKLKMNNLMKSTNNIKEIQLEKLDNKNNIKNKRKEIIDDNINLYKQKSTFIENFVSPEKRLNDYNLIINKNKKYSETIKSKAELSKKDKEIEDKNKKEMNLSIEIDNRGILDKFDNYNNLTMINQQNDLQHFPTEKKNYRTMNITNINNKKDSKEKKYLDEISNNSYINNSNYTINKNTKQLRMSNYLPGQNLNSNKNGYVFNNKGMYTHSSSNFNNLTNYINTRKNKMLRNTNNLLTNSKRINLGITDVYDN